MNEDRQAIDAIASTEFENLSEGEAQSMLTHVVHQARQVRDVRRPIPTDIERAAVVAFVQGAIGAVHGEGAIKDLGPLLRDELNVDIKALDLEVGRITYQIDDYTDDIDALIQQVLNGDPRWVKPPLPKTTDVLAACEAVVVAELRKQYANA